MLWVLFRALCHVLAVSCVSAAESDSVFLYFGQGCYWHIQHEFIKGEKSILGRDVTSYTALVGYAGGTGPNSDGHACYPFRSNDGPLGHAEVVGLEIPKAKVKDFAVLYYSLFVGMNRIDIQDVGRDYRAVIGIPGGMQSEYLQFMRDAQGPQKFVLKEGTGGDGDTLGQAWVWIYDSLKFPFYQGEVYMQFHDDMVDKYPQCYNDMRETLFAQCRVRPTPCSGDSLWRLGTCQLLGGNTTRPSNGAGGAQTNANGGQNASGDVCALASKQPGSGADRGGSVADRGGSGADLGGSGSGAHRGGAGHQTQQKTVSGAVAHNLQAILSCVSFLFIFFRS